MTRDEASLFSLKLVDALRKFIDNPKSYSVKFDLQELIEDALTDECDVHEDCKRDETLARACHKSSLKPESEST